MVVMELSEQEPAEQEPAEQEPAEQEPAEQEPAEQEPAEQEPSEQEPSEQEPSEQEPSEQSQSPPESLPPLRTIGVVRTEYHEPESTPIQAAVSRAERGTVKLYEEYREGLDGLAEFDYAWLITWLHNPGDPTATPAMRQVPFLLRPQQRRVGVFASRGPRRVNRIGLSLVEIERVSVTGFSFAGVDLLDGTPVLDVKPYVTRFDRPSDETDLRCGWFDTIPIANGSTPSKLGRRPDEPHAG
jgi:tRNA (adenine37-N6)-methyltransferase